MAIFQILLLMIVSFPLVAGVSDDEKNRFGQGTGQPIGVATDEQKENAMQAYNNFINNRNVNNAYILIFAVGGQQRFANGGQGYSYVRENFPDIDTGEIANALKMVRNPGLSTLR